MKKYLCLLVIFLCGCAHWEAMTQEQKNLAIATSVAGLVIGAVVANDGNNDHHHDCGKKHHDCH